MANILVTGAQGFIGKHLCHALSDESSIELRWFTRQDEQSALHYHVEWADVIYHLAGVNRPDDVTDFKKINIGLTKQIIDSAKAAKKNPKIIFSSTTQATKDNPYGNSKRDAEDLLQKYSRSTKAPVVIYRLPGVFGPGCKPFYNSVVATFCHQIVHRQAISINDPDYSINLVYVDTVVEHLLQHLKEIEPGIIWSEVEPIYPITLQKLVDTLCNFNPETAGKKQHKLPAVLATSLEHTFRSYE